MGFIGWGSLVDQANTETGGAAKTVADVTSVLSTGLGIGGQYIVNTYSGAPPFPPVVTGFILLEAGFESFLVQESGAPPTRFQLE